MTACTLPGEVYAACTTPGPCADTPQNLGSLGGTSFGYGVTDLGVVSGLSNVGGGIAHAFLWQNGVMQDLGVLAGGPNSRAWGMSNDGSVVVGTSGAGGGTFHAFHWQGGVMTDLGNTIGGTNSEARGVSGDGTVVVGLAYTAGDVDFHAFSWTNLGGMVDLGTLGGPTSFATAASDDGSVIVGTSDGAGGVTTAFRWQGGVMADLGALSGGLPSGANAVTGDGSVVAGYAATSGGVTHAVLWRSGQIVDLGTLVAGEHTNAYGISDDGNIVVGSGNLAAGGSHAFRWTQAAGIQDLNTLLSQAGVNMTGINLRTANAISPNGAYITGDGIFTGFSARAYLVRYEDGIAGITTATAVQSSIDDVARAHGAVMAHQHGLVSPLLGNDKPMTNESHAGAFASAGSMSAGGFSQLSSSSGVTLLGGVSFNREDYAAAEIENGISGALALRYLLPSSGPSLFVEAGGWMTRNADLSFDRNYDNGAGTATGRGTTEGQLGYVFGKVGALLPLGRGGQLVAAAELGRERLETQAYAEQLSAANPFNASFSAGTDLMDIAKVRLHWSEALSSKLDMTLWIAGAKSFNAESNVVANVAGFGQLQASSLESGHWLEYGARLGVKVSETVTIDAFTNGVSGNESLGTRIHSGADVRIKF